MPLGKSSRTCSHLAHQQHGNTPNCARRDGLNSRSHLLGDQVQINIDPGQRFDYDSQLQDLRGDVLKIKQVSYQQIPNHI